MTVSKIFVQKHVAMDMEGRDWDWIDTDETYEGLYADLVARKGIQWEDGVRLVEKTFDDHTFIITLKIIKQARYEYRMKKGDEGKQFPRWENVLVEE